MRTSVRAAVAAVVVGVLGLPGPAHAATKSVQMGLPPAAQKTIGEKYNSDVNQYFPNSVAIHRGDSVRFVPVGFHTVHFLGRSGKAVPILIRTGKTVAGVNDEAGTPFGFSGLPEIAFNEALFATSKLGKTLVYTGVRELQSGPPNSEKPKPLTVRFPRAGLFPFVCDIHPGMKGFVRVAGKGKPIPSAAADARRVKTQLAKALSVAKSLGAAKAAPYTVDVGRARRGVNLFGFVPSTLTVAVGTTVTFKAGYGNPEVHTASTGPGNPEKEPKSYLGTIAASYEADGSPDPRGFYPSDPGATPVGLTPTLHGNGFWSTGVIDGLAQTPVGTSSAVTFAAPGTYQFYCLIHTFMHLTVTAQ